MNKRLGPILPLFLASILLVILINRLWIWGLALETLGGLVNAQFLPLLLMALALGTDAMSLSIGIGLRGVSVPDVVRVSFTVGVFHIAMPLAGIVLGNLFGMLLGELAHWIGALVVAFIGVRMIWGCLGRKQCLAANWVLTGAPLLLLALSVSMDALSVGFSLGTFGYNIVLSAILFGVVGGLMTALGLIFGSQLGSYVGDRAELVGGGVLVVLAIHMISGG